MNHLSDEQLNEYLDGAGGAALIAEAQAHLASCLACSSRLGDLQALFAGLDELPEIQLDLDLSTPVLARLRQRQGLPARVRQVMIFEVLAAFLILMLAAPQAGTSVFLPPRLDISPFADVFARLLGDVLPTLRAFQDVNFQALFAVHVNLPTDPSGMLVVAALLGFSVVWGLANRLLLRQSRPHGFQELKK